MRIKDGKYMRLTAAAAAAVLMLALALSTAAAGDVVLTTPVYLNGLPEYTLAGSAGLANVACDAVLAAAGADVALLGGGLFASSLPAGPVSYAELRAALNEDAELVTSEVTGSELIGILDDLLVYGSEDFPQIGGAVVLAERALTDQGGFCGIVSSLEIDGSPAGSDTLYTLVTTKHLAEVCRLPRQAQTLEASLLEALTAYGSTVSAGALETAAREERICIVADTIDLARAVSQLMLRVPTPVVCNLSAPDLIPAELLFALQRQDRYLCAWFPLADIPHALCLQGSGVLEAVNVPTDISVSQQIPAGYKTANTFSRKTVFVDLRSTETIPDGSQVYVDLSEIYPPGMLLFLYYYDDNGDIVPLPQSSVVAENGAVNFPVSGGTTYVINDRQLNQAALLSPTPQHPWTGGVITVIAVFGLWIVFALLRRRRRAQ